MGLFVKQDEERSQLQQRIAADIAERQRAAAGCDTAGPDGVEDQRMVEGTAHLSKTGFLIIAVLVIAVAAIVVFVSIR